MPGAQVQRDDEYLSVQIPVPNPQKVTYISAIKGMFHSNRNISSPYSNQESTNQKIDPRGPSHPIRSADLTIPKLGTLTRTSKERPLRLIFRP